MGVEVIPCSVAAEMEKSGYGPRQKGVRIGEALQQLEHDDPQLQRCGIGDDLGVPRQVSPGISLSSSDLRGVALQH